MGQKVSPKGLRLNLRKKWDSNWYANKKEFGELLDQDKEIRDYFAKRLPSAAVSMIEIKRMSGKIEITIHTAKPGLVIGKKGNDIEIMKKELKKLTKTDVWIEVFEIKRPDLDAKLVADAISKQIERRMPFRRVLKKAIASTMDAGAAGVKIQISGRLGGAEIARNEWYKEGSTPLHTLRADIDYATGRAETTYGSIGIKVWINKGTEITN